MVLFLTQKNNAVQWGLLRERFCTPQCHIEFEAMPTRCVCRMFLGVFHQVGGRLAATLSHAYHVLPPWCPRAVIDSEVPPKSVVVSNSRVVAVGECKLISSANFA